MGVELEWRLQIMIEVGNAIMENGGLEHVRGASGRSERQRRGIDQERCVEFESTVVRA
jgi:hypothetical protein